MKIYIGSDHAGYELKEALKAWLIDDGHDVEGFGAFSHEESDDYPEFVLPVAQAIASGQEGDAIGIILGGSGQGEAIAANRLNGVRAAVYYGGNTDIVSLAREHNDANILSLGARFLTEIDAQEAVEIFLGTDYLGEEKYERRINQVEEATYGQ